MFTFSDYYYKVEDWNSSYVYGLISRKTQRKRVPIYKIILTKYLQHKIPKQGRGVKGCWEFSRKFIHFWGGRASLRRLAYLVYVQALICFGGDSDLIQEENYFIWTQKVLIVSSTLWTTIDHIWDQTKIETSITDLPLRTTKENPLVFISFWYNCLLNNICWCTCLFYI